MGKIMIIIVAGGLMIVPFVASKYGVGLGSEVSKQISQERVARCTEQEKNANGLCPSTHRSVTRPRSFRSGSFSSGK